VARAELRVARRLVVRALARVRIWTATPALDAVPPQLTHRQRQRDGGGDERGEETSHHGPLYQITRVSV
jgi:hypothetical protein